MWWSVEFVFALRCVPENARIRRVFATIAYIQGVDIIQAIPKIAFFPRLDVYRSVERATYPI